MISEPNLADGPIKIPWERWSFGVTYYFIHGVHLQ